MQNDAPDVPESGEVENPPAFPSERWKPMPGGGQHRHDVPGMTLLDYFAGQALAGLLSDPETQPSAHGYGWDGLAEQSYRIAEAMLIERAARAKVAK